jgi:hypothetical protein
MVMHPIIPQRENKRLKQPFPSKIVKVRNGLLIQAGAL